MTLRTRLTVAGGGAVFVALAIASPVIYFDVRSNLHDQIDVSLIQSAQKVAARWNAVNGPLFGNDGSGYFQVIPNFGAMANGDASLSGAPAATSTSTALTTRTTPGLTAGTTASRSTTSSAKVAGLTSALDQSPPNRFVPLLGQDGSVARGLAPPYFRDVRYRGTAMRLYTMPLSSSREGLVRTARPLTEANATIARVRWLLLGLTLGGALAAALLGRLAANAVLRPVRALVGAVREVSVTRDLGQRIPMSGRDELASLAADFNAMLAALDESHQAQQQLIADASHELRTPLTAHRANIELLARPDLPVEQRQRVLGAAVRTMERLSALVGDLIQAARDGRSTDVREPFALDELVAEAVERARHRAPDLRFESQLQPYRVIAARSWLERAVDNVLENAIKWSPPGGTVEVRLAERTLTVRDHGPGIAEADLPHVFDRFYRAPAARAQPGSGLGLAIVKQTVDDHGGSVAAANADGGGALLTLRFAADGRQGPLSASSKPPLI